MPGQTRVVAPGPQPRTVRTAEGLVLTPPADWELLPPGDAGLTRRVKAAGPTWTVQVKKGRKIFSQGIWAPAVHIAAARAELEQERATPAYAKRRAADSARRERKQVEYVGSFRDAVLEFLDFPPRYEQLANRLADVVAAHATPVGSGTVARTERIPIEERAELAVIAWMRHQTTAYDSMKIQRVRGKRREVRRELAAISRRLLEQYRSGRAADAASCPLQQALERGPIADGSSSDGSLEDAE
ncbi:MAG: DUF2293 domain-containing protein [Pirellulales bacterium]